MHQCAQAAAAGAALPIDDRELWALTGTVLELPALVVSLKLGLFAALDEQPRTSAEVAASTGVDPRAAGILLRFLASKGMLTVLQGRFSLTPVARSYLLQQSSLFWGGLLDRLCALPLNVAALSKAVVSGAPTLYGPVEMWQEHAHTPALARSFAEGAHCRAGYAAQVLARELSFELPGRLLDVGGGMGSYAVAFAEQNQQLEVTLLELEPACALAREFVRDAGQSSRVRILAGDMFTGEWPTGMNAVWLSDIFHDWPPAACRTLASRAFQCLVPGGRIFVNEVLLDEARTGPSAAIAYDLALLLCTAGGRQYGLAELREILAESGFDEAQIVARAGVYSVISAGKKF